MVFWKRARFAGAFPQEPGSERIAHDPSADLERLIRDNPELHVDRGELTSAWSVHSDTLRYIYSLLTPGSITLETGCGQTTIVFAIVAAKHTCIMPDAGEAERVQQYCAQLGLSPKINFIIESSDIALSGGKGIPNYLDFVLIDGAHAFPAPIVDWYYAAPKLQINGLLGVDDYKMPSVKVLYDFLRVEEEEWEFIAIVRNTAFFRKLREQRQLIDWKGQIINATYRGF
jgi:Methyltransferase domain